MGLKYVGLKMKNVREIVLGVAIIVLMLMQNVNAATITSVGTGAWNTAGTWDLNRVPVAGDNVVIAAGNTVTLITTAGVCTNLTVASTGMLSIGAIAITVSGTTDVSGTLEITSATGVKTFTGLVTINSGGVWTNSSANSPITMNGGLTNNGSFTAGSGVYTLGGTNSLNGSISIPSISAGTNITNNGSLTVATSLVGTKLTNAATGVLNIGGTCTVTTLTATASGNTVNYTGTGQTLKVVPYHHLILSGGAETFGAITTIGGNLTLSGSATATTAGNLAITGSLIIGDGTTLTVASTFTFAVTGTTTIGNGTSGTLTMSSTSGTKTFTGLVTVNLGGTWNNSGNCPVNFRGGISNLGTFSVGTGIQSFTTNPQSISGVPSIGRLTITSVMLSCNNNLTVNTALVTDATAVLDMQTYVLSGTLTTLTNNGKVKTSCLTSTSATPITTGKTWTGTVEYAASGDQTIVAGTYNNLTVSGSGNKSLAGAVTLGATGVLTFNGGVVVPGANILMLDNTATGAVANASNTSYVDGALKRKLIASTSYLFPVGISPTYYPFTFVTPGTITAGTYMSLSVIPGPTGGTLGTCVNSISSEYWRAVVSVNNIITGGVVSLGRSTGIGSYNCIARSASASPSGSYDSYKGSVSGDNINTSNNVGAIAIGNAYFAMAVSGTTPPTITTPTSASVNTSSALLGGNITNTGCTNVSERGIYYSTTNGFADGAGTKVSETPGPYNTGAFTISVTGLMFGTTYYYKAFATNSGGTVYTTQGTFTTTTTTFPLIESFESPTTTSSFPGTTSKGSYSPSGWVVNNAGGSSNCDGLGTSNNARLTASSPSSWLFTPAFTATAGKLYYVSYTAKQTTNATTKNIYLCTAQSSGSAITSTNYFNGANLGATYTTENSSSWFCTTSGTYYFGFEVATNSTSAVNFDCITINESNPVPITWDGSTDTDWNTPANWDLNRVPISSDQIIVPGTVASNNWPVSVPSGTYNEITLTNGSAGTITIGTGTAISMINNLTIASNGQPVTIANAVSIGGNLSIGATGNAATYSVNGNISTIGTCIIGNNSAGSTFNFAGKITANGNLTLGQSNNQTFNITVCDFYVPFVVAANSASGFTIYGTVNYTGAGDQIMLPKSYMGNVTMSGSGNRYQLMNMDFNGSLDIADVSYYPADHNSLTWGSGNNISNNGAGIPDNSPYYGAFKSQRWQSILYVADLNGGTYGSTEMSAGDYLRSLSFYVQSKASSSAFKNFTIKVGHTDATKIVQDPPIVGNFVFEPSPSFVAFNSQDVTTISGWNNHIFDNDFQWNGTQNILVEITWNNVPLGSSPGGTDKIRYTDGVYAEDLMISAASNGDVTSQTWGSNYNARPNLLVNYIGSVHDINIAKNWNNTTGEYVAKGNTVTFDGSTGSHDVNTQTIVTNNSDFYNATFINPNGYIISTDTCTVENTLTMTAGNYTTGSNILELGVSASSRGTLTRTSGTVIGYFKRWFTNATISDVLFPLGTATYYRPGLLSFSSAPASGGSVTGTHIATDAGIYNSHLSTTPLVETSDSLKSILTDGYWNFSPNTLSGGQYDVELTATGYAGITDYTKLHMLKRPDANSEWALVGNHITTAGSNAAPVLQRTGVTGFSDFVPSKPTSTLPISLLSFTATCNQGVVDVRWITSSEVNNNFYTVERSSNLLQWETIAQVNGAGNSNSTRNYMVTDGASNSLVYYRLKQTDYNSKYEYFAPVAVQSCESDESFVKVVVNPIKDKLELLVSGAEDQQIEVSINNGIGEMLFQEHFMVVKGENRLFIDLSMLSPGIYFCNVKLNNGKTHVLKVVITR